MLDNAISTQDATNNSSPSWKIRFRPKTSSSDPEVMITAARPGSRRYGPLQGVTDMPVSWLILGSRMLTADVFALTTSVERQVAASTPVLAAVWAVLIGALAGRAVSRCDSCRVPLEEQGLHQGHVGDLGRVDPLIGGLDQA